VGLRGGYAGEAVTRAGTSLVFAPDRGLSRAVVARASYTLDPNRSVAFEGAARQNGRGVYIKAEYSQARGQHWRAIIAVVAIGGHADDFLGQYHRNSNATLTLRYRF
jgi:predicted component of type VI protein secretion system